MAVAERRITFVKRSVHPRAQPTLFVGKVGGRHVELASPAPSVVARDAHLQVSRAFATVTRARRRSCDNPHPWPKLVVEIGYAMLDSHTAARRLVSCWFDTVVANRGQQSAVIPIHTPGQGGVGKSYPFCSGL